MLSPRRGAGARLQGVCNRDTGDEESAMCSLRTSAEQEEAFFEQYMPEYMGQYDENGRVVKAGSVGGAVLVDRLVNMMVTHVKARIWPVCARVAFRRFGQRALLWQQGRVGDLEA